MDPVPPITTWEKLEPHGFQPAGRNGHSAALLGNRMVVFGGSEGAMRTNTVVMYDTEAEKWSMPPTTGAVPAARSYHAVWVYKGEMYVHGGESSDAPVGTDSEDGGPEAGGVDDAADDSSVDSEPVGGAGSGAGAGAGAGGRDSGATGQSSTARWKSRPASASLRRSYDDVAAFNPDTLQWRSVHTRLAPLPRKGHSTSVLRVGPDGTESVIMFGGIVGGAGEPCSDLYRLDLIKLGTWQCMWLKVPARGAAPSPRSGHTATAISDSQMAVFGGACGAAFFSDLYVLDMRKSLWSRVVTGGVPPTPRHGHCTTVVKAASSDTNSMLVVFGGIASVNNQQHFPKDLFLFDLTSNVWAQAKVGHSFPPPRYGHSLCCVPSVGGSHRGLAMRHAASRFSLLLFGGLNAMYCPAELWALHVIQPSARSERELLDQELRDRQTTMSETLPSVHYDALGHLNALQEEVLDPVAAGSGGGGGEVEEKLVEEVGVGILELKKRLNVTERTLLEEQAARRQAERERDELKALLKTATTQLAAQRSAHLKALAEEKARAESMVEDARAAERQSRADLRRAVQVLCMHDLASQMRLEVWQRRHSSNKQVSALAGAATKSGVIAESKLVAGASWTEAPSAAGSGPASIWARAPKGNGPLPPVSVGARFGVPPLASRPQPRPANAGPANGRVSPIQSPPAKARPSRRPVGDDDSVYTEGTPRL